MTVFPIIPPVAPSTLIGKPDQSLHMLFPLTVKSIISDVVWRLFRFIPVVTRILETVIQKKKKKNTLNFQFTLQYCTQLLIPCRVFCWNDTSVLFNWALVLYWTQVHLNRRRDCQPTFFLHQYFLNIIIFIVNISSMPCVSNRIWASPPLCETIAEARGKFSWVQLASMYMKENTKVCFMYLHPWCEQSWAYS